MNIMVILLFTVGIAGITLFYTLVVLAHEFWKKPDGAAEAQRHCMEEASRLLENGASDDKIEIWLRAARNPETAIKLRNDNLPGYGMAF